MVLLRALSLSVHSRGRRSSRLLCSRLLLLVYHLTVSSGLFRSGQSLDAVGQFRRLLFGRLLLSRLVRLFRGGAIVGGGPGPPHGTDAQVSLLAVFGSEGDALEPLAVLGGAPYHGPAREARVAVVPLEVALPGGIRDGVHAPVKVELAAVFSGNVAGFNEGLECGLDFGFAEDEDLGDGDGVEPALYPAPDGGEEDGGADNEDA